MRSENPYDKNIQRQDKRRTFAGHLAGRAALAYSDIIMLVWTVLDWLKTGEAGVPFYILVTQNVVYLIFLWCGERRQVKKNRAALAAVTAVSVLLLAAGIYMIANAYFALQNGG